MIAAIMVSRLETAALPTTPLVERMSYHLRSAMPDSPNAKLQQFYRQVEQYIPRIPTIDATPFLDRELNRWDTMSTHLGPEDIERHGFTWFMRSENIYPILIRLYVPSGLPKATADLLMKRLYKDKNQFGIGQIIKRRKMHDYLTSPTVESTNYFASAEVLVRTMVALIPRGNFPTALVDGRGEPIGFYLRTPTWITKSKNMEITTTDAFFERGFLGGLFDTYGPINLPGSAQRQYDEFKKLGIMPYAEYGNGSDLQNMLLFDLNNRFFTFNRLGYRVSGPSIELFHRRRKPLPKD